MTEQPFKRNFLQHALAVQAWMDRRGATGGIVMPSMAMRVSLSGTTIDLQPQFYAQTPNGAPGFTHHLIPGTTGFVGWTPQPRKPWPSTQSKLAFKRFAQRHGITTPAWTRDPTQVKGAFLVKRDQSTLGLGQRGPFYAAPSSRNTLTNDLDQGEFYEQFIPGELLKAWYWGAEPVVVEIVSMPSVTGDGQSTVRDLVESALGGKRTWSERHANVVSLWDMHDSTIPKTGQKVVVDYQYMSPLNGALFHDYNVIAKLSGTPLLDQLLQTGASMYASLDADSGRWPIYSVDGIIDSTGKILFLEANCNPLIHPAFYEVMLDDLFSHEA